MPHYSSNILPAGAFFDIVVYPPSSVFDKHTKDNTQCPSIRVTALIDTGASMSCVDDTSVAKYLKLVARDKYIVSNAGGEDEQYLYDVGFQIPISNSAIIPLQVFGINLNKQPYKALIGRDLLRQCNFIYMGASKFWSLSI